MMIDPPPRIVYEVRIIPIGRKRIIHGVFEAKPLAMMIADAQSRLTRGTVEVWECHGDKETLVKAYPGKV